MLAKLKVWAHLLKRDVHAPPAVGLPAIAATIAAFVSFSAVLNVVPKASKNGFVVVPIAVALAVACPVFGGSVALAPPPRPKSDPSNPNPPPRE